MAFGNGLDWFRHRNRHEHAVRIPASVEDGLEPDFPDLGSLERERRRSGLAGLYVQMLLVHCDRLEVFMVLARIHIEIQVSGSRGLAVGRNIHNDVAHIPDIKETRLEHGHLDRYGDDHVTAGHGAAHFLVMGKSPYDKCRKLVRGIELEAHLSVGIRPQRRHEAQRIREIRTDSGLRTVRNTLIPVRN